MAFLAPIAQPRLRPPQAFHLNTPIQALRHALGALDCDLMERIRRASSSCYDRMNLVLARIGIWAAELEDWAAHTRTPSGTAFNLLVPFVLALADRI